MYVFFKINTFRGSMVEFRYIKQNFKYANMKIKARDYRATSYFMSILSWFILQTMLNWIGQLSIAIISLQYFCPSPQYSLRKTDLSNLLSNPCISIQFVESKNIFLVWGMNSLHILHLPICKTYQVHLSNLIWNLRFNVGNWIF